MSEENFGNDFTDDKERKKKTDRTINIVHNFQKGKGFEPTDELEQLRKEKDNYQQMVKLQAEKDFENEKEEIVSQFPEHKQDEIRDLIGDDPDTLENIRVQLAVNPPEEKQSGRRAPKGKAGLQNQATNETVVFSGKDEYQEYIDSLYHDAKLGKTEEVRADAERKIDELFDTYQKGFSKRDYRFGGNREERHVMTQCIKCGSFLNGRDADRYVNGGGCAICGYKTGFVKHAQNLPKRY